MRKEYAPINEFNQAITHQWRLQAIVLIDAVVWDAGMLIIVLLNALVLAIWRPNDHSSLTLALTFCEVFFQILFSYEAMIKLLALGVYRHRVRTILFFPLDSFMPAHMFISHSQLSYFRDGWNVFDFVILIAGWLALCDYRTASSSLQSHSSLTIFGVIRTLRPLRVLRMLPELRRLTGAVTMALPQILTLGMNVCMKTLR